ncbi:hypothetical protein BH23VER1_BH23VER1_27550 [soil metagenome]
MKSAVPSLLAAVAASLLLPHPARSQNALVEGSTEDRFIPAYTAGSIFYSHSADADFDDADHGSVQQQEAAVRFDYPYHRGDVLSLTAGLRYRFNRFEFSDSDLFGHGLDLHRIDAPFQGFVDRGKWNYWFRLEPGLASDFADGLTSDAFRISALALASYAFSERFSGTLGAFYSNELGQSTLLPVAGFIWKPDPQWSISLTVPRAQIAYAPTADWIFALSAYPSGGSWDISDTEHGDGRSEFNFGSARAAASIDYRLGDGPAWAFVDAGFQIIQNVELVRDGRDFDQDLEPAAFVNVGLKLRF